MGSYSQIDWLYKKERKSQVCCRKFSLLPPWQYEKVHHIVQGLLILSREAPSFRVNPFAPEFFLECPSVDLHF